jgi:hypothetical protein
VAVTLCGLVVRRLVAAAIVIGEMEVPVVTGG